MKKELKLFLLGAICLFMVILLMPNQVSAATTVTDEASLRTALEKGESVILQNDITITQKSTDAIAVSRNRAGVAIKGNATNDAITIDGNGKKITTSTVDTNFEVYGGSTVTFKNVTIENTVGGGRCIDTRVNVKLVLDNTNLKSTKTSGEHDQTLTIGGSFSDKMKVEIKNSTIAAGVAGYGIITFNDVNLTIDNSKVSGYGALYMKSGSADSTVTIKNSELTSEFNSDEPSNSFGTIVLDDNNIEVMVIDSKIIASGSGTTSQIPFGESVSATTGNTFTVSGNSEIGGHLGIFETDSKATIVVNPGVISNLEIPQEYLPQGTVSKEVNGEFIVGTENKINVETPKNGKLSVDKEKAIKGETVTITATADEGYKLDYVLVTADGLSAIEVTDNKFVMPDGEVTVSAEFVSTTGEAPAIPQPEKDETPKTGVETTFTVFTVLAVVSLAGLALVKKSK